MESSLPFRINPSLKEISSMKMQMLLKTMISEEITKFNTIMKLKIKSKSYLTQQVAIQKVNLKEKVAFYLTTMIIHTRVTKSKSKMEKQSDRRDTKRLKSQEMISKNPNTTLIANTTSTNEELKKQKNLKLHNFYNF